MYDIIDFFTSNLVNSTGVYLFFNIGLKGEYLDFNNDIKKESWEMNDVFNIS